MRDHRKLRAFALADELVTQVYSQTRGFPNDERFSLTAQLRRATLSVAANIVEGSARESQKDYIHFLTIAFASLREAGYFIELSQRLAYLSTDQSSALLAHHAECAKVLGALIRSLRRAT